MRPSPRHAPSIAAALLGAFMGACIDWGDQSMSAGSSASSATDDDDCDERCTDRLEACGATETFAMMQCDTFCGEADAMQLDCLEMSSCQEMAHAFQTGADICGEEAEEEACIDVGKIGCDPLAGITCCNGGVCESSTGRCCLPANQPQLSCTSNAQCCGNATCLFDPNDSSRRYCR